MSVRLAVPTRGRPHYGTVEQLERIARAAGLPPTKYQPSHLSAADCRNQIVKWVMEETTDDIIMCDDDVIPHPDILNLADHGLDIVAAPTMVAQKQANLPYFNVYRNSPDGKGYYPLDTQFSARGLHEADAVGTGCIFISRRVLNRLKPVFNFAFDEWGVMTRSEDMAFCEKARAAGFKIHADFDVPCEHITSLALLDHHGKLVNAVAKAVELSRSIAR